MAGGNIKVVVRVRPFNNREKDRNAQCIVHMKDTQTVLTPPNESSRGKSSAGDHGQKTFAFDKSYWSFNRDDSHFAGQDNLFTDLGTPLLDNAFKGYNNCIFAYGQTGSGKSYSMMGYGAEYGVIPRICQSMFERIDEIQQDKNLKCTVEVSYLEIYNERVRDLLNPATKGNLKVREHPSTGPYVEDLAKLAVRSFKEIENLMDEGNKARTVAATNMNETSSRSHAVFTLTLTQRRHDVETSMDTEKVAKISLVDLAGSERATSTGATGARLKEGAEINRSLSTLGRVIAALADLSSGKQKKTSMVPYRDSVLTWLLKDSLGGNSLTAMIAAISPADINFEETLSTLRYADSAKRIKNHAVVNEDPNARMIRELKEELAQLRSKLGPGGGGSGLAAEEQYAPGTPLEQQFVSIMQADGTTKRVSKAEIAEQLSQSEKLYTDLNQTWEQKLQKTEQIQKEREAALEELGISISKGFVGLSTPKKMPHLVNLSDDPLLAECLIYNLKPGSTIVGNTENDNPNCEIKLNGSKILREHCTFDNSDGTVTVTPVEGAAVMVNGLRIDKAQRLKSGNRIILGDFQIFRFNHPQEAKAERAEHGQSLLRHSVTASQLGSPSPSERPSHERSLSKAGSDIDGDISRSESPIPSTTGRESDWSFARREAAAAILGIDQKINHLTDEELDSLFDDVQRARALRRGRTESRMLGPDDDESESASSYAAREKYMSNGTIDNFSLDTALTIPSTPQIDGDDQNQSGDEQLKQVRDNMQAQLDKQKEEYQEQLRTAEASSHDVEELKAEKQRMEDDLKSVKESLQEQLRKQKEEFEIQLQEMFEAEQQRFDQNGYRLLTATEKRRAAFAVERWRNLKNLAMAELMLRNAALLKEAQVMSQQMDKGVNFQFAVVDQGQVTTSSYDMVLSGIAGDETDDEELHSAIKPCVAVRVADFNHHVIHLWSVKKLDGRVQAMKQMYQYHDRPGYMEHLGLENPFIEEVIPHFSFVGDAHVPLAAVFEARVQDYAVDVVSPYTRQSIGLIKLSLEPSSAEAPPSTSKFNIVMHDMVGFAEREGTDVHAQLSVPGISEEGGVTTTQMIRGFDEGPIRFESVHSMSVPLDSPINSSIQVAVYARVSTMHLDKLLSWDEVRELSEQPPRTRKKRPQRSRLPESEFYSSEQHDVFARVQILELSENGNYEPVEVEQNSNLDDGVHQLHQGLQRRIKIHFTHTSSESLEWEDVAALRIGDIKLIDPLGKSPDMASATPDIPLKFLQTPAIREESGGTTQIIATAQWDSSLHESILLDRPTADRYSVQLTFTCDASSKRTNALLSFKLPQMLQIKPRAWIRPQTMFKQLWRGTRVIHSTSSIFSITLTPPTSKRATDLWRLDSRHQYIKGEEDLSHWSPRGISLIHDYVSCHRRRQRITEVEGTRASLARLAPPSPTLSATPEPSEEPSSSPNQISSPNTTLQQTTHPSSPYTQSQTTLLQKTLTLWSKPTPLLPTPTHLATPPLSPPSSNAPNAKLTTPPRSLTPTITPHKKNPLLLKAGPLLTPSPSLSASSSSSSGGGWIRRHAELRPPYLHLYSVPEGEEVSVLNLRNAHIDAEPVLGRVLESARVVGGGSGNVFCVYGTGRSEMFAVPNGRGGRGKGEWILGIDGVFGGGSGGSGEDDEEGDEEEGVWEVQGR
ncbi:kinesin-like protein Klp8 [Thelotrema lepadinum]|nr:kinesin-like protein Klp8 [Thelotrema lepadinum]